MAVSVLGAIAAAPSVVHPAVLAAGDATTKKGSSAGSFVLIVVIVVAALLFLVSSRRKRANLAAAAPSSAPMLPGTEVLTRIGAIGTVIEVTDEHVLVELAPGVQVRWAPDAIARVLTPAVADDGPTDAVGNDFDPQLLPPEDRPPLP